MGVTLLLLYVIFQTIITATLGGVTLPFSDSIGKVTPVKPKPLPASTVSSSVTKSSLICDSKDITPKSFPTTAKGSVTKEFSSPLTFTSSSRALPVPKIDKLSIENVKIPESLKEKFLALCKSSVRNAKPDSISPQISLPYRYPFLPSPTKLSNPSPCNFLPDTYTASSNKLSPLPSSNSLPNVPVELMKRNGFSSSSFKSNTFLTPPTIKTLSSRVLDSSKTFETRTPSLSEQFHSISSPLSAPCSSPYPLLYKSLYLPGVKTPLEPLSYRPFPYKGAGNNNFPSLSISHTVLSPKTLTADNSLNSLPHINEACMSPYLNTIRTSQILKPNNPIQLPESPSNIPISTKSMSSAQNTVVNNILPPKKTYTSPASVAFESTLETPKSVLSSISLRDNQDPLTLLPYLWAGKSSDITLNPCTPPLIAPPAFTPPTFFFDSPKPPLVPISPTSPIVDVLSNRISSFDCSKNIDVSDVFPIIGVCTETIEKINPADLGNNCQTCFDSKHVPSLEQINLHSPCSYQECFPFKCSPPIIPSEPIFSSYYSPSRISQTPTAPVSYINQTPTSPIAQVTSNMVSSVTNLVSNIVQNILSSYKSDIHSVPQNIPQTATYATQSDPYADVVLIPQETLSVLSVVPFPQENPGSTISILPDLNTPVNCINAAVLDSTAPVSIDTPCLLSAFEVAPSHPVLISSPQPSASILPPSSLITFSSPQFCPSYLPSPILPSYPVISSPFYMEAPVFKKRSSKKDFDVEKIIELMLLAEILNNDENFDWDDLDTLLAFLSLS